MKQNRLASVLTLLGILLLCVEGLEALAVESFLLQVDPLLPLLMALVCLLLCIGILRPKIFPLAVLVCAALVAVVWRLYSTDPAAEFNDLLDRISGLYYEHFYDASMPYVPTDNGIDHSFPVTLIFSLIALYLTLALSSHGGRMVYTLMGVLPLAIGCLAVNGDPEPMPLFALLLALCLTMIGGDWYNPDSARGRAAALALLPLILLLSVGLLLHGPDTYNYTEEDIRQSERFDKLGELLRGLIEQENTNADDGRTSLFERLLRSSAPDNWAISGERVDLTHMPDEDQNSVILRVTADADGILYLRRRSYGNYLGTGWSAGPAYSGQSSLGYAASAVAQQKNALTHTVQIELLRVLDDTLLPYYTPGNFKSDVACPSGGAEQYTQSFVIYPGSTNGLRVSFAFQSEELRYREYARKTYTELPESTRQAALAILSAAGIRAEDSNVVEKVAEYVRGSAAYSQAVGPFPTEDYAIYFLQTASEGYCIHFATAATVLYRALGIPARLTDGFLVEVRSGQRIEVPLGQEHAWVEIYRDGFGWLPVDVTASTGHLDEPHETAAPEQSAVPTLSPVETAVPSTTPETAGAEPSVAPSSSAPELTPSAPPQTASDNGGGTSATENNSEQASAVGAPFWIVLGILLLILLAYVASRLYWRVQIQAKDTARAAIALHRLSVFSGIPVPDVVRHTAEQAFFGRTPPGEEQLALSIEALQSAWTAHLESLSIVKQLLFRLKTGWIL